MPACKRAVSLPGEPGFTLLITAIGPALTGGNFWIDIWNGLIVATLTVFCITRIGLLASVMMYGIIGWAVRIPLTTDLSVWYSGYALPGFVLIACLLIYGYRTATAGKSLFAGKILPD